MAAVGNPASNFEALCSFGLTATVACWSSVSIYRQSASREPVRSGSRWHVFGGSLLGMFVPIVGPLAVLLIPNAPLGLFSGASFDAVVGEELTDVLGSLGMMAVVVVYTRGLFEYLSYRSLRLSYSTVLVTQPAVVLSLL
jgi:uncharacterized membrane protein YbhN (UPF0104 family)